MLFITAARTAVDKVPGRPAFQKVNPFIFLPGCQFVNIIILQQF